MSSLKCKFLAAPQQSFLDSGPVVQALLATIATYLLTVLGTVPVLFFPSVPRRLMDAMMGFATGVMVAASCWSLLVPVIERGGVYVAAVGLLAGGMWLYVADRLLPHLHAEFPDEATSEGPAVALSTTLKTPSCLAPLTTSGAPYAVTAGATRRPTAESNHGQPAGAKIAHRNHRPRGRDFTARSTERGTICPRTRQPPGKCRAIRLQ